MSEDDARSTTVINRLDDNEGDQGALTADKYKAVPKLFDANSRVCGTHLTYGRASFAQMLRLYVDAFNE